ncbi:Fanconi anemia group J protein [Kickxella alabastrina]|nr:Fanconi anemia group J protein [Kickxella alabastrina]
MESASDHKTYHIGGVKVQLPFTPYPSQLIMMQHMIRALNNSQNTMIESPTGLDKSLALLCAALAWRRDFGTKRRVQRAKVRHVVFKYALHDSILPTKEEPVVGLDQKKEKNKDGAGENDDDVHAGPAAFSLAVTVAAAFAFASVSVADVKCEANAIHLNPDLPAESTPVAADSVADLGSKINANVDNHAIDITGVNLILSFVSDPCISSSVGLGNTLFCIPATPVIA